MGDNNSPIQLTETPQVIATFNKPIDLAELIGNLDGVIYLYNGSVISTSCIAIEESGNTYYGLTYDDGAHIIAYLTADGNNLLCHSNGGGNYLFDVDFKHQNRKFFEQASGVYAIEMPVLSSDANSPIIATVSGSAPTITIAVSDAYEPKIYDGSGARTGHWFNNEATSSNLAHMISLIDEIIKLEYSVEAAGGITVTSSTEAPNPVTDNWNLFTDGSAFVPLRIVSRFPSGSPVKESWPNIDLAVFNRAFSRNELQGHLYAVYLKNGVIKTDYFVITPADPEQMVLSEDNAIRIILGRNNNIFTGYAGVSFYIYDIDLDHQFQRALPSSDFKHNVQIPQLLDNPSAGQGIGIKHLASSQGQLTVYANSSFVPYICEGSSLQNQLGNWANSLSPSNASSLLQAIIAMEFEGFDETPISIQVAAFDAGDASGFEIVPLIPQTLS